MLKAYTQYDVKDGQGQPVPQAPHESGSGAVRFLATPQVTLGELTAALNALAHDVESSANRPSAEEIVMRIQAIERELVVWDACVRNAQETSAPVPLATRDGEVVFQRAVDAGAGATDVSAPDAAPLATTSPMGQLRDAFDATAPVVDVGGATDADDLVPTPESQS